MKTVSPLRYPGGKSAMAGLLARIRELNELDKHKIAEPFAGGAGASLSLLMAGRTPKVLINDADPTIHAFWWALVHNTNAFIDLISEKRVCMTEWRRQRDIYRSVRRVSITRRGFAAFYLNRCNRSGIIMNGGPVGGIDQKGMWKIDARFNKHELIKRCKKIAERRNQIRVSQTDGIKFIAGANPNSTFFFIDPPYYQKGKTLYLNSLDDAYHKALASKLKELKHANWVLSYDDCPEIRQMYRSWARIRPFIFNYVAAERRSGKEILIAPRWMKLPGMQESASIAW